jgi:predicted translin family RNA/ssDNA-binding protein
MEPALIDVKDFVELARQLTEEDERREMLIKRSREVLKLSKNSIYAAHRGEVTKAKDMSREVGLFKFPLPAAPKRFITYRILTLQAKEIAKRDLLPIVEQYPALRYGAFSGSMEEFAEAVIFSEFLSSGRVPTIAELEIVNKEEYLGGIMDFTGELNRYAVLRATARDLPAVNRCRDVCDQLFGQLMLFEWRNGNLRRKFDAVKYTLKKLEQESHTYALSRNRTSFIVYLVIMCSADNIRAHTRDIDRGRCHSQGIP